MKQKFLSFFFIACALFAWAMPAKAAVDWSALGGEVVANGEYYIYNVNQGKFMIEKALSGAEEAICFKAEASSGKFKFKYGTKYINRPTNTWGTTGILYVLNQFDETNHQYYIIRQYAPAPGEAAQNYYYKASSATTIAESAANATPDADCQWVFIPKATFDANKWFAAAATVEAGGEYYIFNVGKGQFLKFQATTDKLGEAIPFTVANASTGKFYLRCTNDNKTWAIQTNKSWYKGNNGTACVLENTSNIYNIIRQYTPGPGEPTNNYYYSALAANTSLTESLNDNSSDYSKWLFIPSASFDAFVPAADKEIDREDEWTDVSVAAPTSNDFYYLYNPASQCFLGKNGATANPGVSTDPERATMFYVKKNSSTYGFGYTDQASQKYIGTSTNAATSVTYFTPEETSTNRYHLQKSGTYFYVNMSGSSPAFAVGATPNEYSRWVFIPRAAYISKMAAAAASAPTDKWLAKAESPGEGGLFYIYNPASKRFMNNKSLATQDSYATLYHVSKTAANTYAIMYLSDLINGEQITYVDAATITNSWQGMQAMNLTATAKTTEGKTNRYMLNRIKSNVNYYLVSSKTSNTNYTLNIIKNDNTNYKYVSTSGVTEGDMWNEWMFIPATAFEAEIATAPSEPDTWGSQGSAPEIGKQYFLYNVEAQRFFKHAALTTNQEEAVLCTIGGTNEAKSISFINPSNGTTQYVIANLSGGYSATSYSLDWDETATDSKQYYIYHQMTDEMGPQLGMDPTYDYQIHLRSNKTYTAPDAVAIQTGERPADINGKFKWAFIEPAAILYYSASTEIYEGEGTVLVSFASNMSGGVTSTDTISTGSLTSSISKTAYFFAMPDEGYQFMGWKLDPLGDFVSREFLYGYDFTISSTDSEHPDNVTLYAYFEKYDAEVFDTDGIKQGDYETLAGAITAASKGYTIKLKRNITGPLTINKGVTIDFNGYTISGTENDVVTVSAPSTDTVTFADGAIQQAGGVELRVCTSSVTNAINVTAGILVINSGHYTAFQCWNQSGVQAYVINRTGGNVRVNGGYFRSYTQDMTTALWTQRYQKYIFNGSNIKLYGGYFAGNCDELQEVWKYNDTYTLPIVSNNVGLYVGADMELVNNPVADPHTDVYIYKVQSAFDEASVVATADGKKFSSLADAIAYANNNAETTMTIRLAKNCELEAGTYTIPEKATLIVPYSSLHTEPLIACPLLNNSKLPKQAYRTLTLASGVHIDVFGAIELGGCAYSYGNGATGTGRPNSDYGQMIMNEGSEIVLNNGANLRAWGFVTGAGTIDARRGARVDEMFQVYDFKGGRGTLAMYENGGHKAFPMNQYFIQNVEVKTTYRPGSALYTTMAAVNVSVSVKVIGVDTDGAALFKMKATDASEDTWVRKWYNPATDQQVYDINNSADISNLKLPLSSVIGVQGADFDSKEYILPITNNFKIHVLAGEINITQDVAFLPGAELEIDKQCYGNIKQNTTTYFYDSEQWGTYVYNGAYASKIKYCPGGVPNVRNISSAAGLGDAQMNIHGTLKVDGGFRTTAGGANIFSTNADAGTVSFTANALTTYVENRDTLDTWTHQVYHAASADNDYKASADAYYIGLPAYPAKLQNANGYTPTQTESAGANAGKSFCYMDDEWKLLEDEGCLVTDGENYYAKPKDYVQVTDVGEDSEHLYHSAVGGRKFILLSEGCQCWEVEDVAGHPELKHSIHPDNDVYYYYDEEDGWKEKRFTITWKNWNDEILDTYEMKMGAKLQYLGSIPTRGMDEHYYTYDFAGWDPAIAPNDVVSGDATYKAQFSPKDCMYMITFKKNDEVLKTQYLKIGEMPDCSDTYTLAANEQWDPAISPVTKDVTYNVITKKSNNFTITFVNYDGEELDKHEKVSNTTTQATVEGWANALNPVKPALYGEEFDFAGWTPEITAATADAVYTATYTKKSLVPLVIQDAQTISDTREVTDLYVTQTGVLTITGDVTATNFILESNGSSASGQFLAGYDKLTYTHAYFDMKLNAKNHQWYGVAVPWPVNATSGISVNCRTLELGKDFDIIYYDGARRAAEGKNKCWQYVQNDGDKTLVPGRLYMIGLMMDAPQGIRFEKKAGDNPLLTTTTSVTAHSSAIATDANWNGVANPALFHAFVNAGADDATYGPNIGQVYNPDTKSYSTIDMSAAKFVVGQGAFVQGPNAGKAITVTYGGAYAAAPRRAKAEEAPLYDVRIAPAEGNYTDRLFVRVEDEKEADKYVIGKDLAKLGVSKSVAQMWINRYDAQLCLNTVAPVNGVADYPLGISVPAAGDYTITNNQSPITNDQYELYLTKNGEVIWNLSEGAFVLSLEKGTTNAYGLRLNTNKMPTAIDEAVVDAQGQTRKVLINNQIFILRGDKVYSIDGQLVK